MLIAVTGASGFIGREVCALAEEAGHRVRALVRSVTSETTGAVHALDLIETTALASALRGVDAVIHCAASLHGDADTQQRDTVDATSSLIRAMQTEGVPRLVLLSSFAVYDYRRAAAGSALTEDSPTETVPAPRGPYIAAKLAQEALVRQASAAVGGIILRPGLVYGPGRTAFYQLATVGAAGLRATLVGNGLAPLCHVRNCAAAALAALPAADASCPVLNIVDDKLPTRREYLRLVGERVPFLDVPWSALAGAAGMASLVGVTTGMLHPQRMAARCKPLEYPNTKATSLLAWRPEISVVTGLQAAAARG